MLKALFADEESLNKLTTTGLVSGAIFFVAAGIVYDRMVDADNPDPGLLPLVGILVFVSAVVAVFFAWGNLERRRMAYQSLKELAELAGVSSVKELKGFLELEAVQSVLIKEITVEGGSLSEEEAEQMCLVAEEELLTAFRAHEKMPSRYNVGVFHEVARPIMRQVAGTGFAAGPQARKIKIEYRRD